MPEDFEDIDDDDVEEIGKKKESMSSPDSAFDMIAGLVRSIPIKVALFVFLLFIFISSDLFIDWGLSYIKGAVNHRTPTTKGTLLQGLFLTLGFVIASVLVDYEFL
jgi:hypothetical protein